MALTYCAAVRAGLDPWNTAYHDNEYGVPLTTDDELFERLILEINQAGLSWLTILKKREAFSKAYHGFRIAKVAAYKEKDIDRLLADAGIIRNRLKVRAAVENARRILALRESTGAFAAWLEWQQQEAGADLELWKKIFRREFVFTGGEIVREFLLSTGYLPGAHEESCPAYARIARLSPPWKRHPSLRR